QPALAVRGGQAGGRAVLPGVHVGVRARYDLAALLQRLRPPPGPRVAVCRGGAEVHRGGARRRVARHLRRRLPDAGLHLRGGRRARQHAGVPGPQGDGRLGRNLWFSAVSFGLRIGVHVLLIVLAARVLSTEAFGQYTLAIALGSICVVLCDYGFNFLVTREIARDRAAAATLVPSGALAKGALSLAAFGLLGVTLAILGATPPVVAASVIITLSFAV